MKRRIEGIAHKLGDNIGIDQIYPCKHLGLVEPSQMTAHVLESAGGEPAFLPGKSYIIVAGCRFGHGQSREKAIAALKAAGVGCILAQSFARSFYRCAVNLGLPIAECPAAIEKITDAENITIDFDKCEITSKKAAITFEPLPDLVSKILASGGLLPYVKKAISK